MKGLGKENLLRVINGQFANYNFYFEVQGYVHGKKILKEPLYCNLFGAKILGSIKNRIESYKASLKEAGWFSEAKKDSYQNFLVPMQGISQRIALEFYSPKL